MERQSTSKLFKIVIAIVAFFVLCSSALLFASCGVSKDDGHEHKYPETPNATVPATCGTPGYIVYECTECGEQFKVEISLATGKHTFNENDVCTNCGMTKTQADLLTQAAFKSAIDDLKNTLGTLATGAQLQGLNDLSQAQVKTLTDALETALKAAITNAQTAITEAVGGSTSGTSSAKTEILQAIQDALEDINGEDATSVQSVLKAEIAKQTAKIEEYNTKLDGLKTSLEAAQGEAKTAIEAKIEETNEAIESAKDAIVAAVSAAQTSIEGKLDDLDEKVGTAQTTLSGEIDNVKTVVDGIQEALKALDNLAKTTDVGEVKTLVEDIKTTLTKTIAGRFDSIDGAIAALTNSESGIAASVKSNTQTQLDALKSELETLITTGTSQGKFDEVVSKITEKITGAFDTFKQTMSDTLDQKLAGILTQSHFDTELQKVTETLGKIESKVNEALDKKLSEVEGSIGTAQEAILAAIEKMAGSEEEGEGPVLPTIKGWVQEILYAITGDSQYAPAAAASLMSESVKPEGMQKQIADLWDKAVELNTALTTLSGSLTTLSSSVSNLPNKDEVQGYITALQEELKGKQDTYNTNLTTLNGTLSSVSTKVDNVQSYLEETLYVKLGQMDEKLTTLVQNMGEFYTLFTKLRTYAQKHYADLGGSTWEEVFDNVLSTFGGYFQQLPSYLNKLKGWDDIIDKIVEFAKAQGVVNEDGTLGTNFNKAIDTVKALWDFLGVSEQLDDSGNYKNDGAITTVATLVGMLDGLQTTADDIKNAVDGLVTKFDSLDVSALMQAVKAFNGSNEAGEKVKGVVELLKDLPEEIKSAFINALSSSDIKNAVKGLLETYFPGHTASELKVLAQDYVEIAEELRDIWKAFGDNAGDNLKTLVQWAATNYVNGNMSALLDSAKGLQQLVDSNNGIQATVKAFEQSMNKTLGTFAEGQSVQSMLDDILDKLGKLGTAQGAHQHHWVKTLGQEKDGVWTKAENQTPNCLTSNTYVWYCYVCGKCEKKGEEVITEVVLPTGHVTDWTHFDAETPTFGEGDELETTYYAPTCVNPGRVEGYCVVCGQPTGEWTTVGAPTGIHNYVLEDGTDAEGNSGTQHECTSIHEYVYHCTTCGGAYTEQVNTPGSMGPDGKVTFHNYYSQLDKETKKPTGKPLTDADKAKLYEEYVGAHEGEGLTVGTLTPQQKYEALEANLNKVWDSPATCVEPALTVVECVDCGVRYAYANGTPKGHDFKLHLGQDATCTMDGNKSYAFCPDCGYYFEIPKTVKVSTLSFTAPTFSDGKYHYDDDEITAELAKWLNDNAYSKDYAPKGGTAFKGADNEAAHAYFANGNEATGHEYVVVYTNIPNCVTAQTYMLVCRNCFTAEVKGETKDFDHLYQEEDGDTVEGALFSKDKDGKYWVKDLSGSETGGIDADTDAEKVDAILDSAVMTAEDSDLAKQFKALNVDDAEKHKALAQWMFDHNYGKRADKDLTVEDFEKMTNVDMFAMVMTKNVVVGYSLPVKGHTFNEVVTTVVGVCVMYPRHQFFCSVCGQGAVDPSFTTSAGDTEVPKLGNAKVPYFVTGKADAAMAYTVPEEKVTDLEKDWNKVSAEGAKVDDVLNWLGQYGYLNDFRENIATPWNKTELETVTKSIKAYFGIDVGQDLKVDDITGLFTGENVLNEYIDNKDSNGDVKPIGHTFNLAVRLDAESCNKPGEYVYICSNCGMIEAWEKVDNQGSSHATGTKQPSWWLGAEKVKELYDGLKSTVTYQMGDQSVDTHIKLLPNALDDTTNEWVDGSGYYYLFDAALDGSNGRMNANIPTGPDGSPREDITESDLVASWNAAVKEEKEFDWLYEHGYLNNVKDTVIENMRAQLAAAESAATQTAQTLYDLAYAWFYGEATIEISEGQTTLNVIETMQSLLGSEAVDDLLDETGRKAAVKEITDTILSDAAYEGKDISLFYTKLASEKEYGFQAVPSNSTWVVAHTAIPVSGHVYYNEGGHRFDQFNDPQCEEFASEELTLHYEARELVYWDGDSWEVCGTFNYDDLDPDFKAQADEYGVIAACKRQNCPLHGTEVDGQYNGEQAEGDTEPFTAGYKAATDHVMHYYKYVPYTLDTATEDAKTDSKMTVPADYVDTPSKVADLSTAYNMKEATEYTVTAAEIEACNNKDAAEKYLAPDKSWETAEGKTVASAEEKTAAAKLAAQTQKKLNDKTNLYTLQMIYNTLHLPTAENWPVSAGVEPRDTYIFYPEDGPLFEGIQSGSVTQDWQPLTKELKPSCWISLRCEWYHYENGDKCNRIEEKNDHTYPKTEDWNYFENFRNCQHGDKCTICGLPTLSGIGDHNLMNVEDILRLDSESTLVKAYNLLKADPKATWATPIDPTCSETGTKVYICTGELEKYYGAYNGGDVNTFYASISEDFWKTDISEDDDNYKIETVATTPHSYVTHYYYLSGRYANQEITPEKWNDGFNAAICLYGYYTQDICQNCKRDGKTVCGDIRCTEAPVEAVWQTEDGWKAFYTPQQLVFMQEQLKRANASMQATIDKLQARVDELTEKQSSSSLTQKEEKELNSAKDNIVLFKTWLKTYPESVPTMDPKAVDLWDIDALVKALDKSKLLDGKEATTENVKELLESITIEELTAFVAGLTDDQVKAIVGSNSFGSMSPFVAPENITKKGEKVTRAMAVKHEKQDHTLAPVVGYQDLKSYIAPSATSNAKMSQVCVICGFTTQEVYGATEVKDAAGNVIAQYNIADKSQINAWNAHLDGLDNAADYEYACEVDTSDLAIKADEGKTEHNDSKPGVPASKYWTEAFPDGHYSYDEETTLAYDGTAEQADKFVGVDLTGTSVVDIEKKLTMSSKTNSGTEQRLDVHGNVTFRGPEEGEKAELDLSGFSQTQITGGTDTVLTFKNLKVNLGDSTLFGLAGKVIFRNCEVTGEGVLISTNANNAGVWTQITIENSTFKTTGDIAIYTNKYSASITATNSTFEAARIGVAIRIGEGHFTDCTFKINKAQGTIPEWGNGTAIKAQAGLEIGNPVESYASDKIRYATVTLTGENKFEQNDTEVGSEVWSNDVTKIAIFSCEPCKSTVTIDSTTKKNLGSDMTNDDQNVELIYKVNADLPATEVAALITSVAAEGGVLVLPDGLGTITVAEESPLTVAGKTELNLGDNTLEATKGFIVSATGDLRIEGGTIEAGTNGTSQAIAVKDGGKVTLTGTELTLTDCMEGASTYGIYGEANTAITVAESTIYNNYGPAIGTNAHQGPVTLVLTDSSFFSDMPLGKEGKNSTDSTSVGLLLNNKDSELFAGGCLFYGTNAAAWIRGGKAMFAGCTFVSGGVARANEQWYSGAGFKGEAQAAVVIGNGNDTVYGNVEVEIIDCEVSFRTVDAETAPKTPEAIATTSLEKIPEETTKDYNKNTWALPDSQGETGKTMTIVAVSTTTTTVSFSDEATATKFIGTELKKGDNVFMYGDANIGNFNVSYQKEVPPTEEGLDPTYETVKIDITVETTAEGASSDLEDVAENGGKIVLPAVEEGDIEMESKLVVGSDTTIDLNGNKLKGDVSVEDGASLKIEGGTYEGGLSALAPERGEGSQVTLEDVTTKNDGRFGIFVGPTDDAGSSVKTKIVVTITDSRLEGNIGLFVNGRMDGAIINITNSAILGNNGCGLSVCGEAEVDATNSVFFGSATAVQMASGTGTFTDCTFVSANDNFGVTEFGENTSIPTATLGNFVINSRGGGYNYPVNVTLAGENTKFITAKMDDGSKYTVKDILVEVSTETKNIALNWTSSDNITHLIGYYEVDETPAQKVTVTVVEASPSADSEVRVNLTNTTDNDLTLKVGTNVFVWTDNKTAKDDVAIEAVQAMVKGVEIAAKD